MVTKGMDDSEKLTERLRLLRKHIENVRENCDILGDKLIDRGEVSFGINLIANGHIHDNSKFKGIEWEYMHSDIKESHPELFLAAVKHHSYNNFHHPEAWSHISNMPRIYVAEMACDLTARSQEFGNDIREWIKSAATKKFDISVNSKKYKELRQFVDLLLEPAFK